MDKIKKLKDKLENADAILIGIGAGMSTSSGLYYAGERFYKYFFDFYKKYGITDMYSGGFYPFEKIEEYWAWWSRHIYYNRYDTEVGEPYKDLLKIVKNKDYFVITTNVDHQLQKAGFEKNKLFYMQGDYGLFQCSTPCHKKTYDNKELVLQMINEQKDMKIPTNLIPKCPICKENMTMNLRIDSRFVEDEGLKRQRKEYENFIELYKGKNILFLELGVGYNTPAIIHYPFLKMTIQNPNANFISINKEKIMIPNEMHNQCIEITRDIKEVLKILIEEEN
ncbi:MAG: Sir2 silent information regulator family NAD-dependent deacetylase [Erysipelotrichaceae bacterium]|nr:Sir2 silent information regulator family NAD-dependent deacetylase [Erysipelotrichaceae bacterium]